MPDDTFDPDDENEIRGFGSGIDSAGVGSQRMPYAATGGTTPVGGTPGFVNLGQMLALNRGSGTKSADTLNKDVSNQGAQAENGINNALSTFKTQADAQSNAFDPNANLAKAGQGANFAGYQGPKELDDAGKLPEGVEESDRNSGINMTKVRGDVAAAQDRATALGAPGGVAAEAAKAQSLTPRQAAASAFYMSSGNPAFKATSDRFKGLGDMLTTASKNASAYGIAANKQADANTANYGGLYAQKQNAYDDATAAEAEKQKTAKINSDYNNTMAGTSKHVTGYQQRSQETIAAENGFVGPDAMKRWIAAGRPGYEGTESETPSASTNQMNQGDRNQNNRNNGGR